MITYEIDDLWQADLVEMIPYSKMNKGFKYMLTVIDVFSKYAWAVPVQDKTGWSITEAFKSILGERVPRNVQTDKGLEFYNKDFQSLTAEYKIKHYSSNSELKASVVERFNRTLQKKMWKRFTINGNYKWIDMLPELLEQYNNTKHRTIKITPVEASKKKNEQSLKPIFREEDRIIQI